MYDWQNLPSPHVVVGIEYKAVVTYKKKPLALCLDECHARRIAAFLNAAADVGSQAVAYTDAGIQAAVRVDVQ